MHINYSTQFLPLGRDFWRHCARQVLRFFEQAQTQALATSRDASVQSSLFRPLDFSSLQVIVPAFAHANLLREALTAEVGTDFILPRINTVFGLLDLLPPSSALPAPQNPSERLMELYAMLRQAESLRAVLGLHSQLDMLPLAQTILKICDEMSAVLLPALQQDECEYEDIQARWDAALKLLPTAAQSVLSEEANLVWTIWKAQSDQTDPIQIQLKRMRQLAQMPKELVWITPVEPSALERDFLCHWQQHHPTLVLQLDWRSSTLPGILNQAWKMMPDADAADADPTRSSAGADLAVDDFVLVCAHSLEEEAQFAAQTIQAWLVAGKQSIAVIAQDRIPARRLRALLERAGVSVLDETGWKLSTSLAAASLNAWFELVAKNADTIALLDLLKSPFCQLLKLGWEDKNDDLETLDLNIAQTLNWLESVLRRENVQDDWHAILHACRHARTVDEREKNSQSVALSAIEKLQQQTRKMSDRKSLSEWAEVAQIQLQTLGLAENLKLDNAGSKIWQILNRQAKQAKQLNAQFDFAEWRQLMLNELDQTSYKEERHDPRDSRVTMLPLNGARLRHFDAIWILGADAVHLPSQAPEFLFFANSIRAELGLATRESRQKQQMRDLAELLINHRCVFMSYQAIINGEENAASPWLELLDLSLKVERGSGLQRILPALSESRHAAQEMVSPRPSAAHLRPEEISSSSTRKLLACPYQYFGAHMLKLSEQNEWSDDPDRRDVGIWLHDLLYRFHTERANLPGTSDLEKMQLLSQQIFNEILVDSPVALGFYLEWLETIPHYVTWLQQHEMDGWTFLAGEQKREHDLATTQAGKKIKLIGRLDRIDTNAEGETYVIDYKTKQSDQVLKLTKQADEVQLPFYHLLTHGEITNAAYLPLRSKEGGKYVVPEMPDLEKRSAQLGDRIINIVNQIDMGAALPANGDDKACQYCELNGVCRKGAW